MRPLTPLLLLTAMLLALTGCATVPSAFPLAKGAPTDASPTMPSACLARGKAFENSGDWATAYRWYARGGAWNTQGRSTGFPGPGTLSEPEESQRFLCIAAFLEATRHLIVQGIRVDEDGVSPLYVSISEAQQTVAYFRNAHPNGYAGMTAAQMKALGPASGRGATMDNLQPVDRRPSSLQVFQSTVSATSNRPADRGTSSGGQPPSASGRLQPAIIPATAKHGTHAEAARLYREAAAKYPDNDVRREEMLKLATDEERAAAAEGSGTKSDLKPAK